MMQEEDGKDGLFCSHTVLKNEPSTEEPHPEQVVAAPLTSLSWETKTEKYAPILQNFPTVEHESILESAQKWIRFPGRLEILFPLQTIPPLSRKRSDAAKDIPPEIEADRQRKLFVSLNLKELFLEQDIEKWMLLPFEVMEKLLSTSADPPAMFDRKGLFPLQWFDTMDFESMTPKDWLDLGDFEGVRYPIPARAFIPKMRGFYESETEIRRKPETIDFKDIPLPRRPVFDAIKNDLFAWRYVAVYDYDESTQKWIVTDLDNGLSFKISRIYLIFIAEDPYEFVDRVSNALKMRSQCENLIKYEMLIDYLVIINLEQMNQEIFQKILNLATANLKFVLDENFVKDLRTEINLNYQRVQASYEFRSYLAKHPEYFPSVTFPKEIVPYLKVAPRYEGWENFKEIRQLCRKLALLYIPQGIEAMQKVAGNCLNIEELNLFTITMGKSRNLLDFVIAQIQNYKTTAKFLKGFWIENISGQICSCLRSVGKGWLDISVRDWYIYKKSKIFRFIQQVRYRMQDSLQYFMMNSITSFSKYLRAPCEGMVDITDDFVWETNLKTYPFRLTAPAIFYMLIHLSQECAYYSTPLEEYVPTLTKLLEDGCLETEGIRQIDADVMQNLVFANNLYLATVKVVRPLLNEHKALIEDTYKMAIIPLKAYALKYEEYIELYMTNVDEFIAAFAEANKSSMEVKEEILLHKRLKENIQIVMPMNIVIGPFFINVDPLRTILIERRKEIIRRLLEYFVQRMQSITEGILEQFVIIMGKLEEKSNSIERLLELEEFMLTIPNLLEVLEDRVRITVLEYDILDYFFYNLSNEHFGLKWEMIGWPHKIMSQIPTTRETHKVEIEEFKKLHFSELVTFEVRLEGINEEINNFSLQFDPNKAGELSVEAKKTWKNIEELGKLGTLLQSRQEVYELPELSLELLEAYTDGFLPYKDLWVTCSDFLKLEELSFGNPLQILDLEELWKHLRRIQDMLTKALEDFAEKPDIKAVAEYYLEKTEEFRPRLEVIGCLKDENWLLPHWQELARTASIDLKFAVNINFLYCIKKGILDHLDLVKEIASRATLEADEIRRAMEEEERMRKEAEMLMFQKRTQRKGRTDI